MRSGTWCFNPTLFRKTFGRFWPLWAIYALIWIYALPVRCLMQRGYGAGAPVSRAAAFAAELPRLVPSLGLFLAAVFGLAAAAAAFSYLFNARASGLMHTLPVRREGLFLTSCAAGLSGLLIPHVLAWLLVLAAEASVRALDLRAACVWLLGQSALCFIFYSGAVFCAVLAGHILALPVYYGVLNAAAVVLVTLIEYLCGQFLYGFAGLSDAARSALFWLTPAVRIADSVRWIRPEGAARWRLQGAWVLAVYAAAALALTVAALLIYRRRHVETAGDVVAVPALRPVFKYGVALCSGLCFGLLLHELFSLGGNPGLAVNLLLWTAIGYFAAEMLLKKTFRVFCSWKGCLAALLVMGAAIALIGLDAGGFVARVPAAAQVKSVTLRGGHTYPYDDGMYIQGKELTDPELVARVTELHRQVALAGKNGGSSGGGEETYLQLELAYALTGGRTLRRQYSVPVRRGAPVADAARAALCHPAMIEAAYGLDRIDPDALEAYSVENLADAAGEPYQRYDSEEREPDRGRRGARLLYDAVQADFAAGTLGRRYLFDDDPERGQNTYTADLHLKWRGEKETAIQWDGSTQAYQNYYDLTVTLTPQAENTLRVLRELGAVQDGQLLLYGEEQAARKWRK